MRTYRLTQFSRFLPPRWPPLSVEDSRVLLGWACGNADNYDQFYQRDPTMAEDYIDSVRDVVLALFCAGAPVSDIFQAGGDYIDTVAAVARRSPRSMDRAILAWDLADATELCFVIDASEDRRRAVARAAQRLLSTWRGRGARVLAAYNLRVCLAGLGGHRPSPPPAVPSWDLSFHRSSAVAIYRKDGRGVARAIRAEMTGSLGRARVPWRRRPPEDFCERILRFRDFAWPMIRAGTRRLAQELGCRVPRPPESLLAYYLYPV